MTFALGLYIACELIANVTAVKPIVLGRLGLVVPAGVFIYALTFTLLDLIHERLGKRGARQVIATAFAPNLLLALYAQLTVWWPAPAFFDGQAAVARVLGATRGSSGRASSPTSSPRWSTPSSSRGGGRGSAATGGGGCWCPTRSRPRWTRACS